VREGRIRAIALTGAKRTPYDVDVPTIAEQGFPGYAATNWYVAVVSSKVPGERVGILNGLLTQALGTEAVRSAFAHHGMVTLPGTPAAAAEHVVRETAIWKKVIAEADIRLQ
jgi:tripartite-type tricarboxylate transporter receptor subunit TctC